MNTIFLALLIFISLVSCVCASREVKALEDSIKDAISVDFSVYNRDEELFVNIINQDGYRICSAKINRHNRDQLNCNLNKEILRDGDNTFFVTVYSLKNRTILQETVTHFFYDNVGKNWISKVLTGARNHVICTFRSGEECTNQLLQSRWRTTSNKVFGVGGILLAGAYATYSGPLKLAFAKDLISKSVLRGKELLGLANPRPPQDAIPTGHEVHPTGGPKPDQDYRPPAPPSQQQHPSRSAAGLLYRARRNVHKFATARPTQYSLAALMLTAGLMKQESLPVQAIGTQLARLQRRVATKMRLGSGDSVVIEIPLENAQSTEIAGVIPPISNTEAPPVPQAQLSEDEAPVPVTVSLPPSSPSTVTVVKKRRHGLLAFIMRIKEALCDKFHAQPPARRQYLSRVLATGVVVSVHDATELSKRITVQDVIAAVGKGLQLVLNSVRKKGV